MNDEYANDIDGPIALELLPQKIEAFKRRVTELALDLSVITSIEGHSEQEVTILRQQLSNAKKALAAYESRLEGVKRALTGGA